MPGRPATLRQEIIEWLSREPRSVSSIARELGLNRRDLEEDLDHALRTARTAGHTVVVVPARCRTCGFTFGEDRLAKPGKCPGCRGSRILEAQIHIEHAP